MPSAKMSQQARSPKRVGEAEAFSNMVAENRRGRRGQLNGRLAKQVAERTKTLFNWH